ncbi:MAG: hypothetical protein MUF13_05350 [Akkermansiaceae bacterium]|jgi:hypothetical protein|nr:hypothetical protein [Akkermansiaceae bacterium]
MKTKLKLTTTLLLALFASPLALAAEEQDHDHGKESKEEHAEHDDDHGKKGPNGGHLVESKAGFSIEVSVDKDRKARIIFLDKDNKAAALGGQSITGIAGERSAPTKLAFTKGTDKDANVLIADKPLPDGAHVAVILTIKTAPDAKAVTERFELHLH